MYSELHPPHLIDFANIYNNWRRDYAFRLSTIGTSSLTNQICNDDPNEWRRLLRDSANHKVDDLQPEAKTVIDTLADRALINF